MLEQFISTIRDPADYLAVLSLFNTDGKMATEDVSKLLGIYEKYLPNVDDPQYLKIGLAVDLLPRRTRNDIEDFAALELDDVILDSLFTAKELVECSAKLTKELVTKIVGLVQNDRNALPVRVLLARLALDAIMPSKDFSLLRPSAAVLAEYLTSCGLETLEKYNTFIVEVRMKCRS